MRRRVLKIPGGKQTAKKRSELENKNNGVEKDIGRREKSGEAIFRHRRPPNLMPGRGSPGKREGVENTIVS